MFNTYKAGDTNLKINACSGGIYKTYKESWFIRLYLRGIIAGTLFKTNEHYYNDVDKYKNMVVVQMILTSDPDYVLAEIIRENDFNKYFNETKVKEE